MGDVWVWSEDMVRIAVLIVALASAGAALGTPYWIAYEGNDFPENGGWLRMWGDEQGPEHGGDQRSLDGSILTVDGLANDQTYDFSLMQRLINPGPGETFRAEWRAAVDVRSDPCDVGVVIARDDPPGHVAFRIGPSYVLANGVAIGLQPAEFHTFVFSSSNMQLYQLLIDGAIYYENSFDSDSILHSYVTFGDGVMGQRSLSRWDYFRFGVVPEPTPMLLLVFTLARCRRLA
jgi:hypothetical protein